MRSLNLAWFILSGLREDGQFESCVVYSVRVRGKMGNLKAAWFIRLEFGEDGQFESCVVYTVRQFQESWAVGKLRGLYG